MAAYSCFGCKDGEDRYCLSLWLILTTCVCENCMHWISSAVMRGQPWPVTENRETCGPCSLAGDGTAGRSLLHVSYQPGPRDVQLLKATPFRCKGTPPWTRAGAVYSTNRGRRPCSQSLDIHTIDTLRVCFLACCLLHGRMRGFYQR